MVDLKNVPKPNYVMVHQGFVNFILSNCMPYVTLLLLFTPLSIQTMELTCNVSMLNQVISLLEISYFKSLQKDVFSQLPIQADKSTKYFNKKASLTKHICLKHSNNQNIQDFKWFCLDLVNFTKSSFPKKI